MAGAAERIVATATDEVRELALLGIPSGKVSVVPCGVDLEHFTPAPTTNASHSAPERRYRYRLLSVGRLVPRKGTTPSSKRSLGCRRPNCLSLEGLVAAMQRRSQEHGRLVAVAEWLEMADRVQLVIGQVARTDMPDLMRSADLVVCSPWYEPFGIVPLEAMACGVPVVASAVGGMLDTVVDSVTGALVPARDPASAEVIGPLLESPDRRAELARAGLERVRSRYSWDQVAADTAAVYQQTVGRQGAGQH